MAARQRSREGREALSFVGNENCVDSFAAALEHVGRDQPVMTWEEEDNPLTSKIVVSRMW